MSTLTPMAALDALKQIAVNREALIAGAKERYAEIDERAKAEKEQVRTDHREANRALVNAIRQAQALGIRVEDSAKLIGKSPQALYRIEQEIKRYDDEHNPKE